MVSRDQCNLESRMAALRRDSRTSMRRVYETTLDTAARELTLTESGGRFFLQTRDKTQTLLILPLALQSSPLPDCLVYHANNTKYVQKEGVNDAWNLLSQAAHEQEQHFGTLSIGGIHDTFGRFSYDGTLVLDETLQFYHTHDITYDTADWLRGKSNRLFMPFLF